MLTFPDDFEPTRHYIVELVELEIGRRLYVRPSDAARSQWFRFETVPLLGEELLKWTRNPEESQQHDKVLSNGEGFVDVCGTWMTEKEWSNLLHTSVRLK